MAASVANPEYPAAVRAANVPLRAYEMHRATDDRLAVRRTVIANALIASGLMSMAYELLDIDDEQRRRDGARDEHAGGRP